MIRHRRVFGGYLLGLIVASIIGAFLIGWSNTVMMIMPTPALRAIDFAALDPGAGSNRYLVCPAGYCAAPPDAVSPVFDIPATALRDRWMEMIETRPRVTRTASDDKALQYEFVQRSRVFRFPDSITVQFIPLDDGRSTLALYSRSHYGREDFGVNRDRVTAWLAALAPQSPGPGTRR